jgi:aldehyde:ferredoxin oxidoreductase
MKETQFFGWIGNILQVDLWMNTFEKVPLDREFALNYMGGRGFSSRMLYDLVKPETDPLGPDNVLMFSAGPANGTLSPGCSRWHVAAKSPQTGLIGDGCACGFLGTEMKRAGYDFIIIRGRAEKPSYLWIDDDKTTLVDASHLWGKDTRLAERMINEQIGDPNVQVAIIGPAAEKQITYGIILNDMRSAGRGGMGTVMASKHLKAVVVRGTKGVQVAKPEAHARAAEEAQKAVREHLATLPIPTTVNDWARGGVPGPDDVRYHMGILGTRNNQTAVFEDVDKITSDVLAQHYYVQRWGYLCPMPCDHLYVVDDRPLYGHSVQFAHSGNFGSLIGNSDMKAILELHLLTDKLGIDVLTLGPTLAFAMECYEQGILTTKDTDGIELTWGNMEAVVAMTLKIARREGFGDILAEGTRGAAERIGKGSEAYAFHVKGLEPPWIDDPRGLKGWGLAFAVASRGGDHMRGSPGFDDPLTISGKGERITYMENLKSVQDSLEICKFLRGQNMAPQFLANIYHTVTGVELDGPGLLKIGERITNVERAFVVREGITRKDDTLPGRFLKEPMPDGPAKGHVVEIEPMLDEYYSERGWDIQTGIPKREKLEALGLKDIADEMEGLGRLPRQ